MFHRCENWDADDHSETPSAELPTKETYEALEADFYYEPETQTIVHLQSLVLDAGTPFKLDSLPLCPQCAIPLDRTTIAAIGRCVQDGLIFSCRRA